MTIKINGRNYKTSIGSFLKVLYLKNRLLLRRIIRWRCIFKTSDILLLFLLFGVWAIAGEFFSKIDNTTVINSLLSEKAEIFSSVIIVGFIGLFSRASDYKRINKEQHWLYRMVLSAFNDLYSPYYGRMSSHYMPFYCDRTIRQTVVLVEDRTIPISSAKIKALSEIATRRLEILNNYNNLGRIHGCSPRQLELSIDSCYQKLYGLIHDEEKYYKSYFKDLVVDASMLLEELGSMWNQDYDINERIWQILIEAGNDLRDDYYIRMHLYSLDEIEQYLAEQGAFDEMTEELCRQSMALMGYVIDDSFNFESFQNQVESRNEEGRGRLF